jgi:enoyl-CoA hydratase/carnithine racemase
VIVTEALHGGCAITLTDGDAGNLLTLDEVGHLADVIRRADLDGTAWVLLRHRGRDFCLGRAPGKLGSAQRLVLLDLVTALRAVNVPVISAASGGAAGFGAGLLALADVTLVTEQAWLQFPEILGGSAPAIVATWLFDLVPYKTALHWIATGERISSQAAEHHALVTHVVGDLDAAVRAETDRLSSLSGEALRRCKAVARVMRDAPSDPTARRDMALRWFD